MTLQPLGAVCSALLVVFSLSARVIAARAEHSVSPSRKAAWDSQQNKDLGKIDFRCDTLRVHSKPNRHICEGNVILRRDDIMLCCQHFEGQADADWLWQKFICRGDVRAWRAVETVWAQQAEFRMSSGDITLTGAPLLSRLGSVVTGDRITFAVQNSQAHVFRPTGRVERLAAAPGLSDGDLWRTKALPSACPIAPRPERAP